MKKFFIFLLFLLTSLLFSQTNIRITNGEWEPYLSEYSYEYGLASHIVTLAFKAEGIDVEWGFYPWIRSYQIAKSGEWDASAVWWATTETQNFFLISEPLLNSEIVFFYLKSFDFKWESVEDLSNYRVGITRGYDYGEKFMDFIKSGSVMVFEAATDEQLIKMLLAGRIDLFPNDKIVGLSQIKNTLTPEQEHLITTDPIIFETHPLHLIISKKSEYSEYFLNKFNSGLKKIEESGVLELLQNDLLIGKYDKHQTIWTGKN